MPPSTHKRYNGLVGPSVVQANRIQNPDLFPGRATLVGGGPPLRGKE